MKVLQGFGSPRHFGILGLLALLGLLAVGVRQTVGQRSMTSARSADPARVPVMAAVASRANVPDTVSALGTVQSVDSVAVLPRVSGAVVKVEFTPGQHVAKGQELFLIDPRPYQAALSQAQAQLAHDGAVLKEAQVDLARYQPLAQQKAIPQQQEQDQTFVVQQDKGTVQLDQANVKIAQLNVEYCHVAAPIAGRAGALLTDLGNLVGPQTGNQTVSAAAATSTGTNGQSAPGTGLVSIAQLQPIRVSFNVPQTSLDDIRRNQAAGALEVGTYSLSGRFLEKGKLTLIDNQVNTSTGTILLQGTFANTNEVLWPGEFVRTELVVSVRHDVVTVPAQAVMAGPTGSFVYVIDPDHTVRRVGVQVAVRQNGLAVIEKGLTGGEEIVTDGQYRLADGVKVDVRKSSQAG